METSEEARSVILETLDIDPAALEQRTGWQIKPQGACKGNQCVPLASMESDRIDARALAERLSMPLVHDEPSGLWCLGPEAGGQALSEVQAPDLILPDIHNREFRLRSLLGSKVLLVAWASWCGCRLDLPVWQELYRELGPHGLEIVTVALDTTGAEAARPWIEAAHPEHPSLIDQAHVLDELFGITNVPSGVWIDESGTIVRPPETAYPHRPEYLDREIPPDASATEAAGINEVKKLRIEAAKYVSALRDWVAHGHQSRFVLTPEEVLRRSRPRPLEEATAAAHFELGQHLHRLGSTEGAVRHFRDAYRLQPDNWTYKRQAWSLLEPHQTPLAVYGGDWLTDVRKIGAENYYPPLEM
jgi:peroxiredoxin